MSGAAADAVEGAAVFLKFRASLVESFQSLCEAIAFRFFRCGVLNGSHSVLDRGVVSGGFIPFNQAILILISI